MSARWQSFWLCPFGPGQVLIALAIVAGLYWAVPALGQEQAPPQQRQVTPAEQACMEELQLRTTTLQSELLQLRTAAYERIAAVAAGSTSIRSQALVVLEASEGVELPEDLRQALDDLAILINPPAHEAASGAQ